MNLRRISAALLCVLLLIAAGCADPSHDRSPAAMLTALNERFAEVYSSVGRVSAVNAPYDLTADELNGTLGLDGTEYTDFAAQVSVRPTFDDGVYLLRVPEESRETVISAFEALRGRLLEQFSAVPTDGSYERALTSEIYVKDEYVCYLCIGVMPADTGAYPDFTEDMQTAREVLDSFFPAENN